MANLVWSALTLLQPLAGTSTDELQAAPSDTDAEAGQERRFVRALLLAWFASQNRSLFAARCLVEVVIEMYREGVTVDDVAVRCGPLVGWLAWRKGLTAWRVSIDRLPGCMAYRLVNVRILSAIPTCEMIPCCRSCCPWPACSRAARCCSLRTR